MDKKYCVYCHSSAINIIRGRGMATGLDYYNCRKCNRSYTDKPLTEEEKDATMSMKELDEKEKVNGKI